MKIKVHPLQSENKALWKFIKNIVNNAQFSRLYNLLQDDGKGYADHKKFVDVKNLRTILFWDIYGYLMGRELGCTTIKERLKRMEQVK
jgi:hypothetical protein